MRGFSVLGFLVVSILDLLKNLVVVVVDLGNLPLLDLEEFGWEMGLMF